MYNIILQLQDEINLTRRVLRLVESDDFRYFFSGSSIEIRHQLEEYVKNRDYDNLLSWLRTQDYHRRTIKDLRKLCREREITNYHYLTKAQIIQELELKDVERID